MAKGIPSFVAGLKRALIWMVKSVFWLPRLVIGELLADGELGPHAAIIVSGGAAIGIGIITAGVFAYFLIPDYVFPHKIILGLLFLSYLLFGFMVRHEGKDLGILD